MVIVGLANHPIDRGLTTAGAAALARGLGDDDLLGRAEPLHRHGRRCDQRILHLCHLSRRCYSQGSAGDGINLADHGADQ